VGDPQELTDFFTPSFHDVFPNGRDIQPSLFLKIQWRFWNKVPLKAVAGPATENQIMQTPIITSLGAGNEVILRCHHKAVVVSLEIKTTINAPSQVSFKQLKEF
jgi:hypothetical protein